MGLEWYDMIARRNGGYRGRSKFIVEGQSAEDVFEQRLIEMLPLHNTVLDAGCGHGEFTLRMSAYAQHITGFDNSSEMIRIALSELASSGVRNAEFVHATTKTKMPFVDEQFDLIYDRRGPTSIIEHGRVLRKGGTIIGIHGDVSKVRERLLNNRYEDIEIEEFNDAVLVFPNEHEFALFLSDTPGNPDYTSPELQEAFQAKLDESLIDGRICVQERKYIWRAVRAGE
ncbi:class I SAM-dependent methyltransferase [Paenibacillus xylanexedens]|uniref:class I SAM-dependent methyltransferase n=1 Tax=Paenibacillus xylanexedens TaxID=528191 RepID=UPI00119F1231|nr:class I SAM-dependent methyltransferase [Paenibacillus xylanexedens]